MAIHEPAPTVEDVPGPLIRLIGDRRIAYLLVGGFNTVFGFALFVGFHLVFGDGFWNYMLTLACTHVISVLTAFTLHRRFVFDVHGHLWLDLARFETVNLGMLGLNAVLLPLFVEVVGLGVILAQLVAGVVIVITSYLGHSLFSFRRPAVGVDAESNPGVSA